MKRFLLVNISMQPANGTTVTTAPAFINTFFSPVNLSSKKIIGFVMLLLMGITIQAQQNNVADTAYQKVVEGRTAKIVNTLDINDAAQYKKVQQILVNQYFQLNTIHDKSKATVTAIKAKPIAKEAITEEVTKENEKKSVALKQLHEQFIAQLKVALTEGQIEKVKDGMTYSVLPVTWKAYMEMLQKCITGCWKHVSWQWTKVAVMPSMLYLENTKAGSIIIYQLRVMI
jgi:phosphoribosylformylglycinamidine (FGAM) synthase-like enzyme